MVQRACKVLMVDDSEDDRALFSVAVEKAGQALQLLAPLANGEEAIAYLSGEGDYADRARHPYPELMVLDLKMPCKNGFDVLQWMGQQESRPAITVVLSGSNHQCDIDQALALGASYYHVKPSELEGWIATARTIESYASDLLR